MIMVVLALALGPNNAAALANHASMVRIEMSDPTSAIKLCRKAVELDPHHPTNWAFIAQRDFESARVESERPKSS